MITNRLSEAMQALINRQVSREADAAQIYLAYGSWADSEGYGGIANFLFRHAHEERNHMMKVMQYIMNRGGRVKISALTAPPKDPKNIQECFQKIFRHEVDNTTAIYQIVSLAMDEKDWATWNFAQWFVKEQIEEETMALRLLDMVKVAGGLKATSESLLYLDQKIGGQEDEASLARKATEQEP